MARAKIAIVGGGIGGLAAAIALLKRGHSVTLFERNKTLGGKAQEVFQGGYRFDTGPSLLTLTEALDPLLPKNALTLLRLEPLCRYFFANGQTLDASSSRELFQESVRRLFPEDAENLPRYLDYSKRIYDLSSKLFLFRPLHEWKTVLTREGFRTLFSLPSLDPFRSMHRANTSFFRSPEMVQLFNRYATYNGSNPYQAPATLNVIPHVEYGLGGYYIRGGIYRLVEVLEKELRSLGGEVRIGSEVTAINTREGRVTGVSVEGDHSEFDAVISNSDVQWTFEKLLGAPKKKRLEPSTSAVVFLWGMKGENPSLTHHNILFSGDYHGEFRELFTEARLPSDPTIYINISSKSDPSDAPPGCENWFVLVNAPAGCSLSSEDLSKLRETIFHRLKRAGINRHTTDIETEQVLTPKSFEEKFLSPLGSIYGTSSNSRSAAFLRQRNRAREVRGLYFAGGSAHPGGGIPLVALSGRIAAELLEEDLR